MVYSSFCLLFNKNIHPPLMINSSDLRSTIFVSAHSIQGKTNLQLFLVFLTSIHVMVWHFVRTYRIDSLNSCRCVEWRAPSKLLSSNGDLFGFEIWCATSAVLIGILLTANGLLPLFHYIILHKRNLVFTRWYSNKESA